MVEKTLGLDNQTLNKLAVTNTLLQLDKINNTNKKCYSDAAQ